MTTCFLFGIVACAIQVSLPRALTYDPVAKHDDCCKQVEAAQVMNRCDERYGHRDAFKSQRPRVFRLPVHKKNVVLTPRPCIPRHRKDMCKYVTDKIAILVHVK